jgi:hypothetical protein
VSVKAAQKDRKADSKLIKKLAPTLSVKHAKTAAAATSATTATHAATADSATSATNATNAANATNLGGVAASSYLTNSGAIFISTGSSNWHSLNSTDPVEWGYFDNTTAVTSTSAGSVYLVAHPSLPTILYGKKLEATAATVCYSAAASAKLEQVTVSQNTYSTGGNGNGVNLVVDNTQRTGNACRTYTFASPGVLSSLDDVNIDFLVDFSGAGKEFDIGLTGLTLMPTATPAGASHR